MIFSRLKALFTPKKRVKEESLGQLIKDISMVYSLEKSEEFQTIVKCKDISKVYSFISEMLQELQESNEIADEANKTKTLFLANMSHELRTPLNGIVGFTKILKSTNLDSEQEDFVNVIRKSSEDLLVIVNDILDISKIENGSIVLEEVYFNPMEEFENVIESYAANASKKNIDFSLWIDPILSTRLLRSDPGKIKQVLINLISNAVKFTENRGTIDVLIEKVDLSEDDISIKFSVKDTGIGISKEQEEKVFEAFTQADSSTSRKYGGTGLGLAISSKLVHALGGALIVESVIGKGSTFSFTLTLAKKEIDRNRDILPMNMAIYAPREVQSKDSDHYLEEYLLSFKHLSMARFSTFEECMSAPFSMFDALYIHYDRINKEELEKIVKQHQSHSNIILVTKLNRRHLLKEVSVDFLQVLYEPITFSKVEKSFQILSEKQTKKVQKRRLSQPSDNKKNLFSNIHALVVEDNPINQKMIQHTLKNIGITSECANNGQEGVDAYMQKSHSYDIVFMDIQMPVMNGIDATKAILEYEKNQQVEHTPIVAVTANALIGDREHFMSEGMDEYISKPIDLVKFINVLKMYFPEQNRDLFVSKVVGKDILLYKETAMEAKIISAILKKLDYSVDVVENIDELKKVMDVNSYKCVLLDRVHNEDEHSNVSEHIKSQNIPSMLFVDAKVNLVASDKESFTFISEKQTNYASIKEKVDKMITLAQAS